MQPHDTIPLGFCQCGCGQRTNIATRNSTHHRAVKGVPMRFLPRHHAIRPLAERFWEKVCKSADPNGCWEWTARINTYGYGQFNVSKRVPIHAHRMAWILTNGPIPEGLYACHKCDNRRCVRPDHLFIGTATDNNRDMVAKGRCTSCGWKGVAHPNAKMSTEQVREVRARYAAGESAPTLARAFGMNRQSMWQIVTGRSYPDI